MAVKTAETLSKSRAGDATAGDTGAVDPHGSLADELRSSFDFLPATLLGYLAGVGVVLLWFWDTEPAAAVVPWLLAFALMGVARAALGWQFKAARPSTQEALLLWRRWSNLGTLSAGALWGLTGWLFYGSANTTQQTGLTVLIYTYVVAAVPVLANQPRLFVSFGLLCFSPLILRIVQIGTTDHLRLAAELVLIISLTSVLAAYYRASVRRVIALKAQADLLTVALRSQTSAAEAARQQAEQANHAKTQFFSAASHDLRQPLQAMHLFTQALRRHAFEPEPARLVEHINESVEALDGLFTELLDINRIDSGGVAVRARDFTLGELFDRLRLHFGPAAFEKGLALRFRGGHRRVHADPLLVERILRNLVSNALRYTDDGTVLVGCRPRHGNRLHLPVWDSGRGIAVEQQASVFEEFYQVPVAQPDPAAPREGLGLGLAIVRRLAGLMKAPLTMKSVLGRGTVFTLELEACRDDANPHSACASTSASASTSVSVTAAPGQAG
jgi:two-component system, sensor histidine kinase